MNRGETKGVVYMLRSAHRYGPVFAASYMTLRDHWTGPVCVLVGDDESKRLVEMLAETFDSSVTILPFAMPAKGTESWKGYSQSQKTRLIDLSPYDRSVFLDADTLVVGDFSDLFPAGDEVHLTAFANWTTNGRSWPNGHGRVRGIQNRIRKYADLLPDDYREMTEHAVPHVNTGVIGFTKQSTVFAEEWQRVTMQRPAFMCDEMVAQLIYPRHKHLLLDHRWNCSPQICHGLRGYDDARILHLHGYCVRAWDPESAQKKSRMRDVFVPIRDRAICVNVARICDWYIGGLNQLKRTLSR